MNLISITKQNVRTTARSITDSVELLNEERGIALFLSALGAGLLVAAANAGRAVIQTTRGISPFVGHLMSIGSILGVALGLALALGYGQRFRALTRQHYGVEPIMGKIYRTFGWVSLTLASIAEVIGLFAGRPHAVLNVSMTLLASVMAAQTAFLLGLGYYNKPRTWAA